MTNVLDARAWIYCNLGTVISGNLQESSIIGAGLINVTGTLLLSGVYRVREGDPVELAYYKSGRVSRLGRRLRVISAYANPATRTTEVAVGCYLTYQANSAPPPQVFNSSEDTNTPELTGLAALLLIKPTSAKFVAEKCCAALGLKHVNFPLTNQFYKDKFQISGPYLKVLSDLLISENYVGYMDSTETLQLINLNETGGVGPVLNESNIIDVRPINSGQPDADVVYSIVVRKDIKLDASIDADNPDPVVEPIETILERNGVPVNDSTLAIASGEPGVIYIRYGPSSGYWLSGYETGPKESRVFRYQPPTPEGETEPPEAIIEEVSYYSSSKWSASYTDSDRVTSRTEMKSGIWGTTTDTADYYYVDSSSYQITTEVTNVYVPGQEIVEACGFPPEVLPNLPSRISPVSGGVVLKESVTTETTAAEGYTLTVEQRTVCAVYTADGAANIQNYIESFKEVDYVGVNIGAVVAYARRKVAEPLRIRYGEKRKSSSLNDLSSGPKSTTGVEPESKYSTNIDSLTDEQKSTLLAQELDSDLGGSPSTTLPGGSSTDTLDKQTNSSAGYTATVLEMPEIVYTKNTPGGVMLEFTPPYLSDDRLEASGSKYRVIRSDAAVKAKAFAERQNKMRFGKRNGQSIVFPVEYLAPRPYSPIYLEFKGVTGQFRTDSTNIVFDNTGILVSTDAIFSGGVGQ